MANLYLVEKVKKLMSSEQSGLLRGIVFLKSLIQQLLGAVKTDRKVKAIA